MSRPEIPQPLLDALLDRHGGVNSMLFYGSCLRSGQLFDGVIDLYLIVDSYRACYGRNWQALANWLLPPNVFYMEVPANGGTLRCKYTVMSSADFGRGATRWFESYIWGRFTQPAEIVYSRDEMNRQFAGRLLLQCSRRFLEQVLPRLPATDRVENLWCEGLRLSYGSELRAEGTDRARELVAADRVFYEQRLHEVAGELRYPLAILEDSGGLRYRTQVPPLRRKLSRLSWTLRRLQGKTLSVLRVIKAMFTFEGGLDYLAWKLQRHSGQPVEVPQRVRRAPLLFVWGWAWRLYRRGVFR